MAIKRCPYCKSFIEESEKYCKNCGTQLLFPEDESADEPVKGEKIIDDDRGRDEESGDVELDEDLKDKEAEEDLEEEGDAEEESLKEPTGDAEIFWTVKKDKSKKSEDDVEAGSPPGEETSSFKKPVIEEDLAHVVERAAKEGRQLTREDLVFKTQDLDNMTRSVDVAKQDIEQFLMTLKEKQEKDEEERKRMLAAETKEPPSPPAAFHPPSSPPKPPAPPAEEKKVPSPPPVVHPPVFHPPAEHPKPPAPAEEKKGAAGFPPIFHPPSRSPIPRVFPDIEKKDAGRPPAFEKTDSIRDEHPTKDIPPWAEAIKSPPPSSVDMGEPKKKTGFETDDFKKKTAETGEEKSWAKDSGIGIPEGVTQPPLPFDTAVPQEKPERPKDIETWKFFDRTTTAVKESAGGEEEEEDEEEEESVEVEEEEKGEEKERRLFEEDLSTAFDAMEQTARPKRPGGFVHSIKAKVLDVFIILVLWAASVGVSSKLVKATLYDLVTKSTTQLLAVLVILLAVYFFLFLFFLGETLGDRFLSRKD